MATTIDLPSDIDARLNELVAESGRTKSSFLADIVRGVMEDIEDVFEAERVSKRLRLGLERTYTEEEVRRELGLDD